MDLPPDYLTESPSSFTDLEHAGIEELVRGIHAEDRAVPDAVGAALPRVIAFLSAAEPRLRAGGNLYYLGAGTSGRLGVVDASECPPTYGVPPSRVVGVIAGGDSAIRSAIEGAEDDTVQGWEDLLRAGITPKDVLVGLSASGRTPYVVAAVAQARAAGVLTAGITCNSAVPLSAAVEYPIEVLVGPEFVTGSTRMKAGTAQKLVLNILSTTLMIRLGFVEGNQMVDMQLTNAKLIARGTRYVQQATGLAEANARELLLAHGSVRKAIAHWRSTRL